MKKYASAVLIATALGASGVNAEADCVAISRTVTLEVSSDRSQVLAIVSKYASETPGCVCEVVKSAIKASKGDAQLVAAIVGTAATAAPEHMQLISQCGIAAAPDAAGEIQAVMSELAAKRGESGNATESSSDNSYPEGWNPLEFPGEGNSTVGPIPGMDGGNVILRPGPQYGSPPVIDYPYEPPIVTDPNP